MADDLIPVSDEQAKLATKALEVLQGFGGFLREVLGTVPEDLVGVLGGDWLKVRRAENLAKTLEKAEERLKLRGVKDTEPANLTIALPLFQAAANEGRAELQELWGRLLAAAVDPSRSGRVRAQFVDAVKQMEPLDARILADSDVRTQRLTKDYRESLGSRLEVTSDELAVAVDHLVELRCLQKGNSGELLSAFGRELLRACWD